MTSKPRRKRTSKQISTSRKRAVGSQRVQRKPTPSQGKLALVVRYFAGFLLLILPTVGVYVVYLDHVIRDQFEGRRWTLPARVYARPMELYEGAPVAARQFEDELRHLRYRKAASRTQPGTYARQGDRFYVHSRGFQFWDGKEEPQRFTVRFRHGELVELEGRLDGQALGLVRLDPPLIGSIHPLHHEDRILIQREDVPQLLIDALLAVEDRDFYAHSGLDFSAIGRAMWANLRAGGVVQGGSTLTQQLVKNFFLNSDRTLWRKANEAIMALLLERRYDKAEILEAYLNEIYLGQDGRRAIHGFGLGSQFYFDRSLERLQLPEIALLVGIVRGPSYYNPRRHPERARQRRNLVLKILARQGLITEDQAAQAQASELGVTRAAHQGINPYPAFLDLVRRQLRRDYREEDLATEGLRIFTTMDPRVQETAQEILAGRLTDLEKQHGFSEATLEGAVVVTSTEGGEVLAVISDRQAGYAGFNRALDARRPIGSLVKPAIYLSALSRPHEYTLVTLLDDAPLALKDAQGNVWAPSNFDNTSHGQVPLITALTQSYNLATVRLGMSVSLARVIETLKNMGLERDLAAYPALLLGAFELTPVEVAQIYQTLAAGGFHSPLRSIREVMDAHGQPLQRYPLTVRQTLDPAATYLVTFAMQEVVRKGTASALNGLLGKALNPAGKTGTTDELRDSWFAGFTGDRLAVVWVGRDDNRPAHLTGASGALRVWASLFQRISAKPLDLLEPANIGLALIDPQTWLLADRTCEPVTRLPFVEGSEPNVYAPCARAPVTQQVDKARNWLRRLFE